MDRGVDLLDLVPGDPHGPPGSDEGGHTPEHSPVSPNRWPDENRLDSGLALSQIELEVVHVSASASFAVDQLMVEKSEGEVDLQKAGQPWPWLVAIIRGIAVSATTMITRK